MPKQLINTLGTVVVVGILVVATALIAVPLVLQGVSVFAHATEQAAANDAEQQRIDSLAAARSMQAETEAELSELASEIPPSERFMSVSALVAAAASETGVSIMNLSPGVPVGFSPPSGAPLSADDGGATAVETPTGQIQVPLQLDVTASSLDEIVSFLDRLRGGTRLIGSIQPHVISEPGGARATISALAFALVPEGE